MISSADRSILMCQTERSDLFLNICIFLYIYILVIEIKMTGKQKEKVGRSDFSDDSMVDSCTMRSTKNAQP